MSGGTSVSSFIVEGRLPCCALVPAPTLRPLVTRVFFLGGGSCHLATKLMVLEMTVSFEDCDILAFSCYQCFVTVVKPGDLK